MDRETFAPDLEPLLQPTATEPPCGPSVRYEPAYLALRSAREEDDPSLPMGEWERPLKKADWRAVAHGCVSLLERSKDLQLAAWLCDAWVRQHQVAGLVAATRLMQAMVERYWDCVHPQIEDGDSEARTGPFVWLNEALPLTLRLHVPLMQLPDEKPSVLNLAEWEQVVAPHPARSREEQAPSLTREQLIAHADGRTLFWLADMHQELDAARTHWETLARTLDEKLALDAPSLSKVSDTLARLQRACASLLDGRNPRATPAPAQAVQAPEPDPASHNEEPAMSMQDTPSAAAVALPAGPITNRQEAYRMLEVAAAYLERTEPHSPTPYLVKRAVSWGQMSLADLMQEVLREEGDLGRFFSLIGVNLPRD